jgi:hypothetical protein
MHKCKIPSSKMYVLKYILKYSYNIQIKVCDKFKCVTNFLNFVCSFWFHYNIESA